MPAHFEILNVVVRSPQEPPTVASSMLAPVRARLIQHELRVIHTWSSARHRISSVCNTNVGHMYCMPLRSGGWTVDLEVVIHWIVVCTLNVIERAQSSTELWRRVAGPARSGSVTVVSLGPCPLFTYGARRILPSSTKAWQNPERLICNSLSVGVDGW